MRLLFLPASTTLITHCHLPIKCLPLDVLPAPPCHHVQHQTPYLFFPAPPISQFSHECFHLLATQSQYLDGGAKRGGINPIASNQDSASNLSPLSYIHLTVSLSSDPLKHSPCGILTSSYQDTVLLEKYSLSTNCIQAWHSRYSIQCLSHCNVHVNHTVILLKLRHSRSGSGWHLILDF